MNIKTSLTLKFTGLVASILFVFSIFTYEFSEIFRKNAFSDRIQGVAEKVVQGYLNQELVTSDVLKIFYQKNLTRFPNERLVIADSSGNVIFSSQVPNDLEKSLLIRVKSLNNIVTENSGDSEYVAFHTIIDNTDYTIVNSAVDILGQQKLDFLKSLLFVIIKSAILIIFFTTVSLANEADPELKSGFVYLSDIL
jgi:hypothetical protein